ncbi:hypothetical protein [Sphingomonas baiyangensis]|uniref:hypothetical protein n=1 Tax=Sphingomonas baiyangensis TaxID=2572576 RepID=UPI00146CAD70|nr:hypothetical protein [Sphingomonas baiyangensis]
MALNDLLRRHQIALMRADAARCHDARRMHRRAAADYARDVAAFGAAVGASTAPLLSVN